MLSNESNLELSPDLQQVLLDVARRSIAVGLADGRPLVVGADEFPQPLQVIRSSFVTLRIAGELRGCMGSLKATEALIADVARNAFSAAFRDPRFPKLTQQELDRLDIHISMLSTPVPIRINSESDLLSQIRPGVDGLILYEGTRTGTLLPAVWKSLPEPREFLAHLKQKAGLPRDYWSETIRVERYTTQSVGSDE